MKRLLLVLFSFILTQNAMAQIIKSPIDNKEYRYFQLENELKVLLINDEDTDLSAASLDVAVGSASNPEEWLGLAHFLEHMLFLGSKKYPIVGQYSQFIKTNGGRMNAYTAPYNTNYYFSINTPKLEPALDRFSRFFIDPTFNPDFVERERHVVNSEYEARRKGESMRIYSAGQELMNAKHPLARFTIGSNETLADKEDKKVRDALIDFYEKYYSANLMTLVVVSSEPLDVMEKWVKEKFSQIPNKNVDKPVFDIPYFDKNREERKLLVKPDKDTYQLQYRFPMPSTFAEYDTKPTRLLGALIGDESEGSLLALLRDKGYATGLSAGLAYSDPVQDVFNIRIALTENGANHLDEIHELVFAQIKLAKTGIEKWRYDEAAQLADIKFRFTQEQQSINLASRLSSLMRDVPVQDILQYPYLYAGFDEKRTKDLWQYLNPENVFITIVSPTVDTDKVSEYFDVEYALRPIAKEQVKAWESVEIPEQLSLAKKNPFVAQRMNLLEHDSQTEYPTELNSKKNTQVWYHADTEFESPRANFFVALMSPKTRENINQEVLLNQWLKIVRHRLTKDTYAASLAGLNYEIYSHLRGITLRIGGFEDKQTELLSLILNELANNDFSQQEFDTFKQELIRQWRNAEKDDVQQQIFKAFWRQMVQPDYSEEQKIAALSDLTVKDLKKWHKEFFNEVYLRVLSHGDVSKKATQQRVNLVQAWLRDSDFIDELPLPNPKDLQNTQAWLKNIEIEHNDSALLLYYQGANNSVEENAYISLLSNMISSDYYNDLRTQNRVGYIVYASKYNVLERPGLMFFAQSPTHAPSALNDLSMSFFKDYKTVLKEFDEEAFDQIKQALINNITAPDETLTKRSQRYWRDLDREEYRFGYRDVLLASVESLTLEDMQEFYQRFILDNQRVILVQSKGDGAEQGTLIDVGGYVSLDSESVENDG